MILDSQLNAGKRTVNQALFMAHAHHCLTTTGFFDHLDTVRDLFTLNGSVGG
jgi:hypothetical protein